MVKCLKTYESDNKGWVENLSHCKSNEVLMFYMRMKNDNTGEIDTEIIELATSNKDIIKIRDFLNSLDLGDK